MKLDHYIISTIVPWSTGFGQVECFWVVVQLLAQVSRYLNSPTFPENENQR